MSELAIPDFMPTLRRGKGESPAHGGCVVQVASWLSHGAWTDEVRKCGVWSVFRLVGVTINDNLPDSDRHKLAPMAARISGTESLAMALDQQTRSWLAAECHLMFDRAVCQSMTAGHSASLMWNRVLTVFERMVDLFDDAVGRDADASQVSETTWLRLREAMEGEEPVAKPQGMAQDVMAALASLAETFTKAKV